MRRLLTTALLVVIIAVPTLGGVAYAADDPPELYEHINTGGDGDSNRIAVANETAQTFESGGEAHSVTNIRVPLKRVGSPDYVTLELTTAVAGNASTGVAIASVTISYILIPTSGYGWIDFDVSASGASLEANTTYAIVISAPYGNLTSDYILWQKDTGGDGDADSLGSHSDDAGVTWTLDSPTDYLFEVWGAGELAIHDAKVFSSYAEDDDWLFVIEYENTYPPYYPSENAATYFNFQLLDLTGNVTAETNVRMWGYRVGSIYLSADEAAVLEWGSAYTIRMVGNLTGSPHTDYTLTASDWMGTELTLLDDWILSLANVIAVEDSEDMTVYESGAGELLNERGQTIFAVGIPYISTVRPDIMEMAVRPIMPADEDSFSVTTKDIETELGAEIKGVLDDGRVFLGVTDTTTMGGVVFMAIAAVILAIAAVAGHLYVGAGFCYVGLVVAAAVGFVGWIILGVVTFGLVVIWIFIQFSNK